MTFSSFFSIHFSALSCGAIVGLSLVGACGPEAGSPFLTEVVRLQVGEGAGFGEEENVFGPPQGAGESNGSLDVLSLGAGGVIVAKFGTPVIDGAGVDLLVFENPFNFIGGVFKEPGEVSVSLDGETWFTFPCAAEEPDLAGCAGQTPVYAHPETGIDPRSPEEAGGDGFDLADLGLEQIQFLRIVDQSSAANAEQVNAGFDLDAAAAVFTWFDD